jgi:hypothetical protein
MFRRLTVHVVESCLLLGLGVVGALRALATEREVMSVWGAGRPPAPGEDARPGLWMVGAPAAVAAPEDALGRRHARELTCLPAGRVTIVVHGVNDDGATLSGRFKNALVRSPYGDSRQEVYLFRWTQPDGRPPDLRQARNSLLGIAAPRPGDPNADAVYQVEEARRLKDFLAGARSLYREYDVDGRIDVVAHSQGSLITLKALELGSDADDVVFLGSPLLYTGDRQEDVIAALPHVRGVLYNYYTPSDLAVRYMGGLIFRAPCGWPERDLPKDKVVQTRLDVEGHTGYYTEECIRANYVDKLGLRGGRACLAPVEKAREFEEKWRELTAAARLIDPE